MALNPNATGSTQPLPGDAPGASGRESHERRAAAARGDTRASEPAYVPCAPDVPGLTADLIYTLVAENTRDYAIFLMDADGIIKCWGEGARLMKWWTRQQAEGAHLRLLYPDGGSEDGTSELHLQTAAETGEYTGEGHRVRRDGSTFWAYITLTALRDPNGTLVGFSKVTRDFTARRTVEAALRMQAHAADDAQRLVEEANRQRMLVATVSHELRAPLNAMFGAVASLEAEIDAEHGLRGQVERLKRTSRHMLEIIDGVLDMSRAEAGALPIAQSVSRLGATVQEALMDVEPQAAVAGVTITNAVSGGAADLPYLGDEARVRQILVNLVSNAVKFTESGGQITVSGGTAETVAGADLRGPGPWVYARVEDTGRGIRPEDQETIFEPFQQTDRGDQQRGAGLGLSISRQLARAMGGDITVRSEPGLGSTFTVWLPISASEPVPR
jgi:PAS domain S-box-containing protein